MHPVAIGNVTSILKPLFFSAFFAGSLLAACGGDEPSGAGSSGTSGESGTSSGSSGTSGSSGSSGTSGSSDAGPDGNEPVDAGSDAPALPTIQCVDQGFNNGAFNQRCTANPEAFTPGGSLVTGSYNLTRFWRNGGCGAQEAFIIGSASVFTQDNRTFMRYVINRKTATSGDPGVTVNGTWWLQPDGAGNMKRTEVCTPALKGTSETGTYQQTAATPTRLIIKVDDTFEESWDRLP